jgi:hypothetical protein
MYQTNYLCQCMNDVYMQFNQRKSNLDSDDTNSDFRGFSFVLVTLAWTIPKFARISTP